MTKIRLFINTCAISTLAASHPGYNFSANLGTAPAALHPAYNSGSISDLGVVHPAYNFGNDLGVPTHKTTQQGTKLTDALLQTPSLVLPDNPEVLKIKYPKDESATIEKPPITNPDDSGKTSDVPNPKGAIIDTPPITDLGIAPAALHPAYNSGNSTELGATHPAYNLGDDLGVPKPHNTTQQAIELTDELLQKPSLVLPDNPEVLKIKYPKDESATIEKTPLIDSHDLAQDLGVLRPTAPITSPDDSGKTSDVPNPKVAIIDTPPRVDINDLIVLRPTTDLDQGSAVLKPTAPITNDDSGRASDIHNPKIAIIDTPQIIGSHDLDQDLGLHRPTLPRTDIHDLDQDSGALKPTVPKTDTHVLDQDLGMLRPGHRPNAPRIDIHNLDQNLDVHKPITPKTDADDSDKTSDTSCSKFVKKFTLIQRSSVSPNTTSKGRSGNVGSRAAAAGNAVSAATDAGESGENAQFRFSLSPDQIKLSVRKGMHFNAESDGSTYSNALKALERTLDSTQAIRNNGKGMTFWVSGIYAQGSTDSMFGNPASTDKHYGIMAGTHYKHEPTQQIFGVAFDVGTGRSIAKTNKDQKTDTKMAQLTLYYNKMLSKNWKFNLCNSFMNAWEHHQRPFTDNTGAQQIAVSNGIDQEFASNIGIGYKQEFSKDSYLEPFFSFNYTFTKQFAHREKNVGADNISYNSNSSDQIGLQFGIKSSFGTEISDSKTFVVMPKLSYTIFAKMSNVTQKSVNISSGQASMSQSGTPGRHLLSATIAVGIADHQADTTTRIAYTGNVQKQRRSHEVMVDWSLKF